MKPSPHGAHWTQLAENGYGNTGWLGREGIYGGLLRDLHCNLSGHYLSGWIRGGSGLFLSVFWKLRYEVRLNVSLFLITILQKKGSVVTSICAIPTI